MPNITDLPGELIVMISEYLIGNDPFDKQDRADLRNFRLMDRATEGFVAGVLFRYCTLRISNKDVPDLARLAHVKGPSYQSKFREIEVSVAPRFPIEDFRVTDPVTSMGEASLKSRLYHRIANNNDDAGSNRFIRSCYMGVSYWHWSGMSRYGKAYWTRKEARDRFDQYFTDVVKPFMYGLRHRDPQKVAERIRDTLKLFSNVTQVTIMLENFGDHSRRHRYLYEWDPVAEWEDGPRCSSELSGVFSGIQEGLIEFSPRDDVLSVFVLNWSMPMEFGIQARNQLTKLTLTSKYWIGFLGVQGLNSLSNLRDLAMMTTYGEGSSLLQDFIWCLAIPRLRNWHLEGWMLISWELSPLLSYCCQRAINLSLSDIHLDTFVEVMEDLDCKGWIYKHGLFRLLHDARHEVQQSPTMSIKLRDIQENCRYKAYEMVFESIDDTAEKMLENYWETGIIPELLEDAFTSY